MGFLDNIGKTISDVGQGAWQKGKDLADEAKINAMIVEEERKIDETYKQIGKLYVQEHGDAPEALFRDAIGALQDAKSKVEEYQIKLRDLKGVVNCPKCGAEVSKDAAFCSVCGTKMTEPAAQQNHCVACGAVVPEGSKFCTTCGTPVETVVKPVADVLADEKAGENVSAEADSISEEEKSGFMPAEDLGGIE